MFSLARKFARALALSTVLVSLGAGGALALEVSFGSGGPSALSAKPHGVWGKTDRATHGAFRAYLAHLNRGGDADSFRLLNETLQVSRGHIVVDAIASGDPEALMADLARMGLKDATRYGQVISGALPFGSIERAAGLASLRAMYAARLPLVLGKPNRAPRASFTYSCTDLACAFNGSGSSDPEGSALKYDWNFGDGVTAPDAGATVNHTFDGGGSYSVVLTVTDAATKTGSDSQTVTVEDTSVPPPGPVTSEGVRAMNADLVAQTGKDVRVGVLSDSFNCLGGYYDGVASGDLPDGVVVLQDYTGSGCADEGRAMAELIHDVAPGAGLLFNTAFVGGMAGFANGIRRLADNGAKVIVDDVIYLAEPMFQDGVIAQAVDEVVGNPEKKVAYFSSAGNFARNSYQAAPDISDSPEDELVNASTGASMGFLHRFDGASVMQDWNFPPLCNAAGTNVPDCMPGGAVVSVSFQWNERYASAGPGGAAQTDLDIYLLEPGADPSSTANVVSYSNDNNSGVGLAGYTGEPVELMQFLVSDEIDCLNNGYVYEFLYGLTCVGLSETDHKVFKLIIADYADDGTKPSLMKYVLFSRSIAVSNPPMGASTLFGHANAAGAEAVGAAEWLRTPAFCDNANLDPADDCDVIGGNLTAALESFSSAGGTPVYFGADGACLAGGCAPVVRTKPGVVGPDGTETSFFYRDYDDDGVPEFYGTSASAPHVAAVAALMLQKNYGLSPGDVYATLRTTAHDMNPQPGFDRDSGYGFVDAELAVDGVTPGAGPPGGPPPQQKTLAISLLPWKDKGYQRVNISWSCGGYVGCPEIDVYRNGVGLSGNPFPATPESTGGTTDVIGVKGTATYTYQICPHGYVPGDLECSGTAQAVF